MKLIDNTETIFLAVSADLEPVSDDRMAADMLKQAIDERGAGHPYRRAVIVSDINWFDTPMLHDAPTISVGGPGVNGVAARFSAELPTVWTDEDRSLIQGEFGEGPKRVALWGSNAAATVAAVEAFIRRGWLDEYLDRCWRFRAGALA